ncbi:MAG TPA: hypothetical protein VK973_16415 [Arenicellales bacterium]|nr:hypothetical protein [Arenicellales bacterium]
MLGDQVTFCRRKSPLHECAVADASLRLTHRVPVEIPVLPPLASTMETGTAEFRRARSLRTTSARLAYLFRSDRRG